MTFPKRMSSSLPRTHNSPRPCTPGRMFVHFVSCSFYANILPRRSTSLHMTEKTSDSSPRASKVRRTLPCSALLAIKSPGWNWLLMGTRVIGGLCDLFIYRFDLISMHVSSAKVVIYDLKKDVRFTITEDWDRSPDSIIVSPSSFNCPYFLHSYLLNCDTCHFLTGLLIPPIRLSSYQPANPNPVLPFLCSHFTPPSAIMPASRSLRWLSRLHHPPTPHRPLNLQPSPPAVLYQASRQSQVAGPHLRFRV
jgi:hypothetical protein